MTRKRKVTEELKSGKSIRTSYSDSGEIIEETHCYGMLDIACTIRFEAGLKVEETYFFRRRMVGRKKYEKERVNFSDMPAADQELPDTGAELLRLARKEQKRSAAKNRREANPLTEHQQQEAEKQIPFFEAASGQDIEVLEQLLVDSHDPNSVAIIGGHTPLYNACACGYLRPEASLAAVKILLKYGADPTQRFQFDSLMDGRLERELTAIMFAGSGPVAMALLDAGAEVNVADENGLTPLMRAARVGRLDVVRVLLGHGADPNVRCNDGHLAIELAQDKFDFWNENSSGTKEEAVRERLQKYQAVIKLLENAQS